MTAELVDEFAETITHIRRLHAKAVEIASELNRARYANSVGYPSLAPLLVDKTRLSLREARRYVTQADYITETLTPTGHVTPAPLPTAREALVEGVLDGEHIEVIGKVVTKLLPEQATALDRELVESILTEQARELNPKTLLEFGQQIANHLNQDGTEPEDPKLAEPVNLLRYVRSGDGRMKGTFTLDPETSEQLEGLITALAAPMPPAPGIPAPRSPPAAPRRRPRRDRPPGRQIRRRALPGRSQSGPERGHGHEHPHRRPRRGHDGQWHPTLPRGRPPH